MNVHIPDIVTLWFMEMSVVVMQNSFIVIYNSSAGDPTLNMLFVHT